MMVDQTITESLRHLATELLSGGKVTILIAYGRPSDKNSPVPVFLRNANQADQLIFDAECFQNLTVYLSRKEIREAGSVAILVKGCDLRAVNVLLHENVVKRENLVLIGVRCPGVGTPTLAKCATCDCSEPKGCDFVVGPFVEKSSATDGQRYPDASAIESKPIEQRWEFWKGHLEKCIRCYACRQVCPLCYCKRCIVEKSMPQWVETSAHLRGNLAWNVVRAFHLTGRCVGCGECQRICPMDIPLNSINQKMAKLVEEWFGFRSGLTADEKSPFTTFSHDDPEKGIL